MSNRRSGLPTKAGHSVAEIREEKKPSEPPARSSEQYLPALGVYGFGEIEPVILAALVTEDPLLLIGASGTGKTYLLNSLSEALSLEHRHYNASLISFDDLVGFPYPDPEGTGVRFLETLATVWSAQPLLIDEISRSKPEQQKQAVFARPRAQGARHQPAAAAPPLGGDEPVFDGPGQRRESTLGLSRWIPRWRIASPRSVNVLDWEDLSDDERWCIAEPVGQGRLADDGGKLKIKIEELRSEF